MEMQFGGKVIVGDFHNRTMDDVNKFLNAVPSDTVVFLCLYADNAASIPIAAYQKTLCALANNPDAVCYYGNVDLNIFNVLTGKFKRSVFAFVRNRIHNEITNVQTFLMSICMGKLVHIDEDVSSNLVYSVKSSRLLDCDLLSIPLNFDIVVPTKDVELAIARNPVLQDSNVLGRTHFLVKSNSGKGVASVGTKDGCCGITRFFLYEYDFNYSKIHNDFINSGAMPGRYCIFMNDDVVCDMEALESLMRSFLYDSRLAVVGAKLYYGDGKIQHIGVEVNRRLGAIHPGRGSTIGSLGSDFNTECCVTFALVAIDTWKYKLLGGMDENLPYDFNDVDYCLRCKKAGYRVLYNPQAEAIHHESVTRKTEGKCGVSADNEYFRNKHRELFR